MNGAFIVFGVLLALGALLMAARIGRTATALLVVSLLVLARVLRERRTTSRVLLVTCVVIAVAAVGFIAAGDRAGAGALERLALWPVLGAPAVVALDGLRVSRRP